MNPRHPIDLFLLQHYKGLAQAADEFGLTYQAIRAWRYKPDNMLKHALTIQAKTKCKAQDLFDLVKQSRAYNKLHEVA